MQAGGGARATGVAEAGARKQEVDSTELRRMSSCLGGDEAAARSAGD